LKGEVKEMIDEVDENESGSIDFDEFLVMVANKLKETDCTNENLREAFKVIFHNVI
jgi:Ca2+-binding EF-hand superfamily protein